MYVPHIHTHTHTHTHTHRPKINPRRECWYLMDCKWLTAWADYVENKEDAEPPGA